LNKPVAAVLLSLLPLLACRKTRIPPENYRFGTRQDARAANLKWWDMFNDPVLYKLVASVSRQQVAAKSAYNLAKDRYDQGVTSHLEPWVPNEPSSRWNWIYRS